ncbi:mitochondrial Rho GTPase 1-like [Silene latifolia]|uniref:mitochondrial Rho GTPase 1-like n=1 Tax=Silene latifolia TaxID=37657 RepID=UPI003D780B13
MRIVVAGEIDTGKSSLIHAAVYKKRPKNVPPVLPLLLLPVPRDSSINIIDTSSSPKDGYKRAKEFHSADVVVLTYACDCTDTIQKLRSYWLPELRRLEVKVPIVIVGCKVDLMLDEQLVGLEEEEEISTILNEFHEIETCIRCSSHKLTHITDVFQFALSSVIRPSLQLFDKQTRSLKPRYLNALKRIFLLCDIDLDGCLCDAEFLMFQIKALNIRHKPSQLISVKKNMQGGVNEHGVTLEGFIMFNKSFIEKGAVHIAWYILKAFGYDNDIRLVNESLQHLNRSRDQSVELTSVALDFLRKTFKMLDKDNSGVIRYTDVEDLFSTAPDCPWTEFSYMNAASTTALGDFTLNRFLSDWVLMTLLEPAKSFEYLKYIMYHGDAASALRLTRMRRIDRQKRKSKRNVYQCFVFGPKKAGKTTLLDSFLGRPFSGTSISTTEEIYAVNVVDRTAGSQKFLVLREIPEAKVKCLLFDRQSLATCDVALFVYDSTDESSFKKTAKLLRKVARHGEETGFGVPSLIVSAKDDLSSYTTSIQDSARLSEDMGIDVPVRFSARSGDISHIFQSIVTAAEHPHLGIPKTGAGGAVTIWKQVDHYHPDDRPDYIALGSLLFGAVAYIVGALIYDYVY